MEDLSQYKEEEFSDKRPTVMYTVLGTVFLVSFIWGLKLALPGILLIVLFLAAFVSLVIAASAWLAEDTPYEAQAKEVSEILINAERKRECMLEYIELGYNCPVTSSGIHFLNFSVFMGLMIRRGHSRATVLSSYSALKEAEYVQLHNKILYFFFDASDKQLFDTFKESGKID